MVEKPWTKFVLVLLYIWSLSFTGFLNAHEKKEDILKETIYLRRELHKIPELGNEEFKTRQFILDYLEKINKNGRLTIIPILKTGVLAVLKGKRAGSILFRAEIDALPIEEQTGVSFCSQHKGIMHACGHDAHSAILLKLADYALKSKKNKHTVLFLFQPAEEVKGGADEIVDLKILDKYNIKAAFALHIHPGFETGKIGYTKGASMAGSAYFSLRIDGPGGHMADSDADQNNPILVIPKFLDYFYSKLPATASGPNSIKAGITKANGGVKSNVIPTTLTLEGSLRILDVEVEKKLEEMLRTDLPLLLKDTPLNLGELIFRKGAPIMVNDANLVEKSLLSLKGKFPLLTFSELEPSFFSEDFAFYSRLYPSFYFSLGCQFDKDNPTFIHTPTLRIDEKALLIGLEIFMHLLKQKY